MKEKDQRSIITTDINADSQLPCFPQNQKPIRLQMPQPRYRKNGISTRHTTAKISTSVEFSADANELSLEEQTQDHHFNWQSRIVQNLQPLRAPAHTGHSLLSLRISPKIYWQWISGACIYRTHIQTGSAAVLGGSGSSSKRFFQLMSYSDEVS